ncbi:MAG: PQQ-binding-like beta-propeller repeat protein [Kiloniellales bacterium]
MAASIAAAAALSAPFPSDAASWERAHADGANSGFVDVVTAPAGSGSVTVPGLGSFAPGVGPVIAGDGTLYIGNEQGRLFAFNADGSPAWSRDLPSGQAIVASAAVGADGAIYVIGVYKATDHRVDPPAIRYASTLHRFLPGGAWLGGTPFPEQYEAFDDLRGRGATSAPPNIWKSYGVEVVMVPAVYRAPNGHDVRLVAFSTSGDVIAETLVTYVSYGPVAGGSELGDATWLCLVPPITLGCGATWFFDILGFADPAGGTPVDSVHRLLVSRAPLPGVAVVDGTPWVIVSDREHAVVGYSFTPGDGFIERFRENHRGRTLLSPPTVLKDGHSIVGTADESGGALIFAQPSVVPHRALRLGSIYAAPTRLANDRFVVVKGGGGFAVLRYGIDGYAPLQLVSLPGRSIASAAASRNHLYISTASAFYSYDAKTMQEVSRIDWVGGGLSPPAIGPQGHVYAIASNILFVFPPPEEGPLDDHRPPGGGGVVVDPNP